LYAKHKQNTNIFSILFEKLLPYNLTLFGLMMIEKK